VSATWAFVPLTTCGANRRPLLVKPSSLLGLLAGFPIHGISGPRGSTLLTPALRKLTDLYMDEFGDTPDIDRPLQLMVVLTDGEANDLDNVVTWLSKLSSRTFVVFAVVGFGADYERAFAAYKQVEASNKRMRVIRVGGSTNPDDIANALLSLIGD